ncbi:MAG TPA: HDOD domain-containing protein, partial [Phycisphaeraceae bacterium]
MIATEPTQPCRIELILRQVDSLPTLPAVAMRLLSLTAADDTHAREVVELISADPALTAKVLTLCRAAYRGVRDERLTVDRAVMLLGFSAIRNAVLSVKVFEVFGEEGPDVAGAARGESPAEPGGRAFDRVAFWTHSLAVGVAAELIAAAHVRDRELDPDEAFVCGLLHDIGKLALDYVLPKSFARIVEMAELNQGNIAEFERRVVGIDHHTAGKRLAEQWRLPHRLQDCIWLHGSSYDTLPKLEHRRLIGLVSLADLIARRQHLGYSGNFNLHQPIEPLVHRLGLDVGLVQGAAGRLHEQLEHRGKALGLHDTPSRELFLQSIQRANQALGRVNQVLELRSRTAASQARVLEAIATFHAQATPGRSVQDVLDAVAASARHVFGTGFYAILYPGESHHDRPEWLISQYNAEGQAVGVQYVEAPPHTPDLAMIDAQQPVGLHLMGLLPWIADYLVDAEDLRRVKLLPLPCGWGTAAVLLHDRSSLPPWNHLAPLTSTWGAAVAAAAQHDGARRLGEQLAQANTALAQAQDRLLRQESMARLGEMAAGAAHEMNNPLAVISGRSQLLCTALPAGSPEQKAAQTIFREAHRLSDLISSLHMLADPPPPQRRPTQLAVLLKEAVDAVQPALTRHKNKVSIALAIKHSLPEMMLD